MELLIHAPKLVRTDALSDHVQRRMQAALGQYAKRIRSVDVKLQDTNGRRGGIDKKCQVIVHLNRKGVVMAQHVEPDMYAAVSLAADKIKAVVGRQLQRRRAH